ncbi:MAG: elongation factor P maturation arginine rhamnosyltransferase EarP [Rhodoferax sp.]
MPRPIAATEPTPPSAPPCPALWDVFCRVIDNFGDVGVTWRLCRQLAERGAQVRLWIDDARALAWMAPHGHPAVRVLPWAEGQNPALLSTLAPAQVWIEAFGCEIAPEFIAHFVHSTRASGQNEPPWPVWINLEYLSAEAWVQRCHGLASPVMHGAARGATKHFFYPGFTPGTGGLLREDGLAQRQQAFDRRSWLQAQGLPWQGEPLASLFCYESPLLHTWLRLLAQDGATRLLVTPGRASAAVQACWAQDTALQAALAPRTHFLPWLAQDDFDHLLWACDFNAVRGEDSLVRALWAGKPFVWHIYPQDDGVHHAKLDAFLDWLQAPAAWRGLHHAWNASASPQAPHPRAQHLETAWAQRAHWASAATAARTRLWQQGDLCRQLLDFVAGKR